MVDTALLDVNVLLALSWPGHVFHTASEAWMDRHGKLGWATCAITEAGFIRLSSSPALSPGAKPMHEAVQLLELNLARPGHEFWECDVPYLDAIGGFRSYVRGHRQATDAYLLGLAIRRDARLVTTDRHIAALLPAGSPLLRHLLVLG